MGRSNNYGFKSCLCVLSRSVMSNSLWPHELPASLLSPWNFPGKNTGADCHFLFQGIFLTRGLNLHLLHWQAFLTTEPPGPNEQLYFQILKQKKKNYILDFPVQKSHSATFLSIKSVSCYCTEHTVVTGFYDISSLPMVVVRTGVGVSLLGLL